MLFILQGAEKYQDMDEYDMDPYHTYKYDEEHDETRERCNCYDCNQPNDGKCLKQMLLYVSWI